ncbi:MAG: hypothetical protein MHMPM18_000032 [Marteilia pararefringens]
MSNANGRFEISRNDVKRISDEVLENAKNGLPITNSSEFEKKTFYFCPSEENIGLNLHVEESRHFVVPNKQSRAEKDGITAGDCLIAINSIGIEKFNIATIYSILESARTTRSITILRPKAQAMKPLERSSKSQSCSEHTISDLKDMEKIFYIADQEAFDIKPLLLWCIYHLIRQGRVLKSDCSLINVANTFLFAESPLSFIRSECPEYKKWRAEFNFLVGSKIKDFEKIGKSITTWCDYLLQQSKRIRGECLNLFEGDNNKATFTDGDVRNYFQNMEKEVPKTFDDYCKLKPDMKAIQCCWATMSKHMPRLQKLLQIYIDRKFIPLFDDSNQEEVLKHLTNFSSHKYSCEVDKNFFLNCKHCNGLILDVGIYTFYCQSCEINMHHLCSAKRKCITPLKYDEAEVVQKVKKELDRHNDILLLPNDLQPAKSIFKNYKDLKISKKTGIMFELINEFIFMHQKYTNATYLVYHAYIFTLNELKNSAKFLKSVDHDAKYITDTLSVYNLSFEAVIKNDKDLQKKLLSLYELKHNPSATYKKNDVYSDSGCLLLKQFKDISMNYYNVDSDVSLNYISNMAKCVVFLTVYFDRFSSDQNSVEQSLFAKLNELKGLSVKSFLSLRTDVVNRVHQVGAIYDAIQGKLKNLSTQARETLGIDEMIRKQKELKEVYKEEYSHWYNSYQFSLIFPKVKMSSDLSAMFTNSEISTIQQDVYLMTKVKIDEFKNSPSVYLAMTPRHIIIYTNSEDRNHCELKVHRIVFQGETIFVSPIINISGVKVQKDLSMEHKVHLILTKGFMAFKLVCTFLEPDIIDYFDSISKRFSNEEDSRLKEVKYDKNLIDHCLKFKDSTDLKMQVFETLLAMDKKDLEFLQKEMRTRYDFKLPTNNGGLSTIAKFFEHFQRSSKQKPLSKIYAKSTNDLSTIHRK